MRSALFRQVARWVRGEERWKLGPTTSACLCLFVAVNVGTTVASLVIASTFSTTIGCRDCEWGLLALIVLFIGVAIAGSAVLIYVRVASRSERSSQLHLHGAVLLLILPCMTLYTLVAFLLNERETYYIASLVALVLFNAFWDIYKAALFLLVREKLLALGPPVSSCVQAGPWGKLLVLSTLNPLSATITLLGWVSGIWTIHEHLELISDPSMPMAERVGHLFLAGIILAGCLAFFASSSAMLCAAWRLTRRALAKLVEREVTEEELAKVRAELNRQLLGVFCCILTTQAAVLMWLFAGEDYVKDQLLDATVFFDNLGDTAGILLLSGIGELLFTENPTAGDISGRIRGLLHSAVLTSRAEMVFEGQVVETPSRCCIASFPGKFISEWHSLTWACEQGDLSSACVFLPKSDDKGRFGKHAENPEDNGKCWCHSLYGEEKMWGCFWFHEWKSNVERAAALKLDLVAVFFPGETGKGVVAWDDLGSANLWNGVGLGGSQKGEVAYLKKRGLRVIEEDVPRFRDRVRGSQGSWRSRLLRT